MEDPADDVNLKRRKVTLHILLLGNPPPNHRFSPATPMQIIIHIYIHIYLMYIYIYSFKRDCKRIYKRNL